jgi:hypothetical protein
LNYQTIVPSLCGNEGGKIIKLVEDEKTQKWTCAPLTSQKGYKLPKQRAPVHHHGTRSSPTHGYFAEKIAATRDESDCLKVV